MKKIIAAAVAAAFVAPAAFAEVTVSGSMAQYQIDEKNTAADAKFTGQETTISIGASSEANNGITVSMSYNLNGNGGADGGDSISVAHASLGKISFGNVSSAQDAVDDKTEILETMDPLTGTADSSVLWTLPTFVDGLSLNVSYAPEDAATDAVDDGIFDINAANIDMSVGVEGDAAGRAGDEEGFGAAYQAGPVRLAYGTSDQSDRDNKFMGVEFKMAGLMVAYETNETEPKANNTVTDVTIDTSALAASYTIGDVSVRYLATDAETAAATLIDYTAYGVHYNMGGGLTALIETGEDDAPNGLRHEYTAVGLKYKF